MQKCQSDARDHSHPASMDCRSDRQRPNVRRSAWADAEGDDHGTGRRVVSGWGGRRLASPKFGWQPAWARGRLLSVGSITWGREIAEVYDETYAAKFEPPVLGPIVDVLADLAGGRPALEFAVGTGRVALPLAARGIAVHGIELSPHMAEQLRPKPGADAVPVTVGDMTTTRVPGIFALVYLVANTIMNVITQDDQLAVFATAGAHLEPGACFLVEVLVPQLRRVPRGEAGGFYPRPGSRRDRDLRRHRGPDRVVASLDRVRRAPGAPLRALPVRLAVRTGPDGQDHRFPAPGPLGGLGPGAVHLRQPKPGRRIREAAVASWHAQSDQVCAGQRMPVTSWRRPPRRPTIS